MPVSRDEDLDELLLRCRVDPLAFTELLPRITPLFGMVLRGYANNGIDIEDLQQEAFLLVYEKLQAFEPAGTGEAWLSTLAVHRAIDIHRKRGHLPPSPPVSVESVSCADPRASRPHFSDEKAFAERVLSCLDSQERDIYMACVIDGLSYQEAMARCSVEKSYGAFGVWLCRIKKKVLARANELVGEE